MSTVLVAGVVPSGKVTGPAAEVYVPLETCSVLKIQIGEAVLVRNGHARCAATVRPVLPSTGGPTYKLECPTSAILLSHLLYVNLFGESSFEPGCHVGISGPSTPLLAVPVPVEVHVQEIRNAQSNVPFRGIMVMHMCLCDALFWLCFSLCIAAAGWRH